MHSSLIASIGSAVHNLDRGLNDGTFDPISTLLFRELKIGLRNLKALLIVCTKSSSTPSSLFSRIQDAAGRICVKQIPVRKEPHHDSFIGWMYEIVAEVHGLAKEADGQLSDQMMMNESISTLTADEVVGIADSILNNWPDFRFLVKYHYSHIDSVEVEVIDAFELQITFLKLFLLLAMRTEIEIHDLLLGIQPVAVNAARIFITDKLYMYSNNWVEQIQQKCSVVNGMAVDPQVYLAYARALTLSTSVLSSIDDDDTLDILKNFLDCLISLLWDFLRHTELRNDPFKVLYERLRFCRTILKKHTRSFDAKFKEQIGGLICSAGTLICSLHQTNSQISDSNRDWVLELIQRFDVFRIHVERNASRASEYITLKAFESGLGGFTNIMDDLKISDSKAQKEIAPMLNHLPLKRTTPQVTSFQEDEVTLILDRLTRGSKQLRLVPISGMPGIGKTTFALELFNHSSVTFHFHARAWCPISQVLDKKKVWIQLLNKLAGESQSYSEMTEDDLANKLRQTLKGKRYLILLDDVWSPRVWSSLKESFPDDSTQSRIMLTSRRHDIVPHALLEEHPHLLRLRYNSECLEILQMNLSDKEGWSPAVGNRIAIMCKGLPLTVVIVAGLLATTEQQRWEEILDDLSSCVLSESEQCNNALELSYKHLPDYLQLCFLYFGAFPEDHEIDVEKLIRLWMAEGFVRKNGSKRIEDIGLEYLDKLIRRSLVMVAKKGFRGGFETCQIHDLLHDFCLAKAKQQSLFHVLQAHDQLFDFNEPFNLQRLSIHSYPIHFKESKLFCPRAHSLLFFSTGDSCLFDMSFIVQIYKRVKVLDIYHISLATGIPSEIELLAQLRYLSISSSVVASIPSSIGNLSNLETFICWIWSSNDVTLPQTLWNLKNLKYLHFTSIAWLILPIENVEDSSNLLELETLSGVAFYTNGNTEKQMRKFPNIRTLKCQILPWVEGALKFSKIVVPEFLNQLRTLDVSGGGRLQCEFGLAENLTKVILMGFDLSKEEIAVIGKLPNLEVLKLLHIFFLGGTLEMEEGEFSRLRLLHLYDSGSGHGSLRRWTASDELLPCLQKLILQYCMALNEIPSYCLEDSSTLEEIEVNCCSLDVESSVREIEEIQKDYGNTIKVHILSYKQSPQAAYQKKFTEEEEDEISTESQVLL